MNTKNELLCIKITLEIRFLLIYGGEKGRDRILIQILVEVEI